MSRQPESGGTLPAAKDEGGRIKDEEEPLRSSLVPHPASSARILLADDNADMRRYLQRLLSESYEVQAVGDREAALALARKNPPDLVLADVMMPRLDGLGLFQALRNDPRTQKIPVILLSDKESQVEALEAGADDYLIKPFSGRELLARVSARLEIARLNREALEREHKLRVAAQDAEAEAARKNDELRRARNALQRALASRTEDVSQLTQELLTGRRHLEIILDSISDNFFSLSSDGRFTYFNKHAAKQMQSLGKDPARLIGKVAWEEFPDMPNKENVRRVLTERVPITDELYYPPLGEWVENHMYPSQDGGLVTFQKYITERKRADQALSESSRRIENILESITDEFNAFDREWRFTYINEPAFNSMRRAKGEELTREDLVGKDLWELYPELVGSVFYHKYHEALREQKTVHFEGYSPLTNRWVEIHAYPSEDGLSIYRRDITERKRAEEQLAYHAYLLENVHDAVIATDERLAVTAWNKGAEQMYGWRADETLGRNIWEVVPVEMSEERRAEALRELEERDRFRTEAVTHRKDGTPVYVEGITIALRGEEKRQITGYVNIRRDITERKKIEQTLQENQQRLRVALESSPVAFTILRAARDESAHIIDFEWLYLNPVASRNIGRAREELIGRRVLDVLPDGWEPPGLFECFVEVVNTGKPLDIEVPSRRNDIERWFHNIAAKLGDGVAVWFTNVTERKRAEEKLRRSEAYLADAQRLSHTGSWVVKFPSQDVFWSQEVFRIYGLDHATTKLSQQMAFQLIHPEDRPFVQEAFQRALRDKSDLEVEHRAMLPDGSIKHLHALGHPLFNESGDLSEYVGTVMDTTERKLAEEALHSAQAELARVTRMTTMGELAASIAHEINQPLTAVATNGNACLNWLAGSPPDLEEVRQAVNRIIRDAHRASDVIARVRTLVQKTGTEMERLDINEAIQEVVALMQGELRKNDVALQMGLAGDLPPVLGDRVQLEQVVLNLIMNGIEAMSTIADRPRELLVTTERDAADQLRVAVQDSGIGLEPQTTDRIFAAFYTTKSEGMGMGLSISRSIIEAHKGHLWATQNAGPGATFQFTLPVYTA